MRPTDKQFISERGELLAYDTKVRVPTLTVELYCKWYNLYLVLKHGEVVPIDFGELEDVYKEGSAFRDHVPNPDAVRAYAEYMNYHLEDLAEELIEGRWKLESNEE